MTKRKTSFIGGFLAAVLCFALIGSAAALSGKMTIDVDYTNIKVMLNGKRLDLKDASGNTVEPFAYNGTTYLPVRAVGDALGLSVSWDGATSTVVLQEYEASLDVRLLPTQMMYLYNGWGYSINHAVQSKDHLITAYMCWVEGQPLQCADALDLFAKAYESTTQNALVVIDDIGTIGLLFSGGFDEDRDTILSISDNLLSSTSELNAAMKILTKITTENRAPTKLESDSFWQHITNSRVAIDAAIETKNDNFDAWYQNAVWAISQ